MNNENDYFDELSEDDTYEVITMVGELGEKIECFVIDAIIVDNMQYLLVVPCNSFNDKEAEAFIIKEIMQDGDESVYTYIEDDNEYNKVVIMLQENDNDYDMIF